MKEEDKKLEFKKLMEEACIKNKLQKKHLTVLKKLKKKKEMA